MNTLTNQRLWVCGLQSGFVSVSCVHVIYMLLLYYAYIHSPQLKVTSAMEPVYSREDCKGHLGNGSEDTAEAGEETSVVAVEDTSVVRCSSRGALWHLNTTLVSSFTATSHLQTSSLSYSATSHLHTGSLSSATGCSMAYLTLHSSYD